jgi:hypothetical protein
MMTRLAFRGVTVSCAGVDSRHMSRAAMAKMNRGIFFLLSFASVFFWQQNRRRTSVPLSDDPQTGAIWERVSRRDF